MAKVHVRREGRAARFWASTGSQTVSILQLVLFLKGARVLFSREWAGLLVSQTVSILQLLKGGNTIFGLGLNWEALLSSDSLGLGVGGMTHVSIAKVVVEKANALDEACFYWCMWLALCKKHSHQHGISCHCGSFQIQCVKENQIHNFDQCWSILVKFDQFWSVLVKTMVLIKFDQN